jgi:hypothetical protein
MIVYCVLCLGPSEIVHIFSTPERAEDFCKNDDRDHVRYEYVIDHPERMEGALQS